MVAKKHKKLIWDTIEQAPYFHGAIDVVVSNLLDVDRVAREEGYTMVSIDAEYITGDACKYKIIACREETDEELADRVREEEIQKALIRDACRAAMMIQEDKDRKVFLELKERYNW